MELRSIATKKRTCRGGLIGALIMALGGYAHADESQSANVDGLRKQLDDQTARIEALKRDLAAQEAKIAEMRRQMGLDKVRGGQTAPRSAATAAPQTGDKVAQVEAQQPVGQAPEPKEGKAPQIAPIFEQPGVLTRRGKFILEPSLQYSYSSSSRIALVGVSVIPALLVGLIDVREIKRNTFVASLTGRYGVTNRFEIEGKVPYVYRSDDAISREILTAGVNERAFNSTGSGIGDVEFTARYQLNEGGPDKAYYVGGLRFKSRTGEDQFEIPTAVGSTATGDVRLTAAPDRLPTGTGFYTLQPSLTMLYPSDPAVLFGSLSYQYNFKRTGVVQKGSGGFPDTELGTVEPAGIFGFNVGLGWALNERTSMSLGYDHQSVGKTEINGATAPDAVRVQLGSLLVGYSYRLDDRRTLNFSLGAGLTRDTPDLQLTLRMPWSF